MSAFQRVPEAKVAKNRLDLDVAVDLVDAAGARIQDLGGRRCLMTITTMRATAGG